MATKKTEGSNFHQLFPPPESADKDWIPVDPTAIATITILRLENGSPVYLGTHGPDEMTTPEDIRARYGGGTYDTRALSNGTNGKRPGTIMARYVWKFSGPKVEQPGDAAPPPVAAAAPVAQQSAFPTQSVIEKVGSFVGLATPLLTMYLDHRARAEERHQEAEERRREEGRRREEQAEERRAAEERRREERIAEDRRRDEERRAMDEQRRAEERAAGEQRFQIMLQTFTAPKGQSEGSAINAELLRAALANKGTGNELASQLKTLKELKDITKDTDSDAKMLEALAPIIAPFAMRFMGGPGGGGGMPPMAPPLPPPTN
jgi:hypothetical protein